MASLIDALYTLEKPPTIREYYDKVVSKYDKKFAERPLLLNRMGICPLHEDHDPSFGVVTSKKGADLYNCFGCGSKGNILDFASRVSERWEKKALPSREALVLVLTLFGYEAEPVLARADERLDWMTRLADKDLAITHARAGGVAGFEDVVRKGVSEGRGPEYFNAALVRLFEESERTLS